MAELIRPVGPSKRQPKINLRFIVVGGGIAGLAVANALTVGGHHVVVVEQGDGRAQSNTGLACPPNMMRILKDMGLQSWIERVGVKCTDFCFRSAHSGEELGTMRIDQQYPGKIDADFYFVMYDTLHTQLHSMLLSRGIDVLLSTRVTSIDPNHVSVSLENGQVLHGDVIIGADGLSSMVRARINEHQVLPPTRSSPGTPDEKTEEVLQEEEEAERRVGREVLTWGCTIPAADLANDPELRPLLSPGVWTLWLGDGFYMSGALADAEWYYLTMWAPLGSNAGVDYPDDVGEDWSQRSAVDRLNLRVLKSVSEPRIHKLLKLTKEVTPLRYTTRAQFENAVDEKARICLVGDAGHPVVPFEAHSAALGIEDACTLLHLFAGISRRDQIARLLNAYEEIRQPRWSSLRLMEQARGHEFSLPPSKQRDGRDKFFRLAGETKLEEEEDRGILGVWKRVVSAYDFVASEVVDDWYSKWEGIMNRGVEGVGEEEVNSTN